MHFRSFCSDPTTSLPYAAASDLVERGGGVSSRYWLYLHNEVAGPFEVHELIRQRGFSREARVCREDAGHASNDWMSVADIPELMRIFRAAESMHETEPVVVPPSKVMPKPPPVVRPAPASRPPVRSRREPASSAWVWVAVFMMAAGAAAYGVYSVQNASKQARSRSAKTLVESTPLPDVSTDRTIRAYLDRRRPSARWEIEKTPEGLYHVTVSWFDNHAAEHSRVYTFEANLDALTVRGLNIAAQRLLSEGFREPGGRSALLKKEPPAPVAKAPPAGQRFKAVLETRRIAIENGDYAAVWSMFSRRKQSEMINAGISESGYIQLQTLRHKLESAAAQEILKTKAESTTERLVLLRETHSQHGEVFLKQRWILEDDEWRLDDEEKRTGNKPAESSADVSVSSAPATSYSVDPRSLPGLSNLR